MPLSPSRAGIEERTDRLQKNGARVPLAGERTKNREGRNILPYEETDLAAYVAREEMKQRRERLIAFFRQFIAVTFNELGVASATETRELEEGIMHIGLTEEEIAGWEAYRKDIAEKQLEAAHALAAEMTKILDTAVEKNHISKSSHEKWMNRFRDPDVSYKAREYFVREQMPEYKKAWEREAQKRSDLLKEPGIKELPASEVRKLDAFFDEGKFLSLHFDKRMDLNAAVHAALLSKRQKTSHLHAYAKEQLEAAAKARAISPTKIGLWLEHIVFRYPSLDEREIFVHTTLKQYIAEWVKVRTQYDIVDSEMRKRGVPQGLNRLPLPVFLTLSFAQRRSYVDMARERMKIRTEQAKDELGNIKLFIRHALDTQDWEEAEALLKKARKTHTEKGLDQDYELDSMERYWKAFRQKNDKEKIHKMKDVKQTLEEMRAIFANDQIPSQLRELYLKAMMDEDTFCCLGSLMYNRVWCREHGYLDDEKECRLEKSATAETKRLAKSPHKRKGLENIKLNTVTDWQEPATVRRYDQGEWAPTIIHMPPDGTGGLLDLMRPRKNNASFRYWATLVPKDVSFEKHRHLVKNVNWVLKRGIRKLKAAGFAFSLFGPPISLQ